MDYINEKEHICPKCGKEFEYTGEFDNLEGDAIVYYFNCNFCGAFGKEWSSINFMENVVE